MDNLTERQIDMLKNNKDKNTLAKHSGMIGYTLLGKYDTPADLIEYEGVKYQPQVTINYYSEEGILSVKLDKETGFIVNTKEDFPSKPIDATLDSPDGTQHFIPVGEARRLIKDHYEQFLMQGDPVATAFYYD